MTRPLAGLTGRGVQVAIIDSGINPAHPHVWSVAGGVRIRPGGETEDYLDSSGHGTAVAGAIREKAPDALLYAVKVFDRALSASIRTIIRALEWCIDRRIHVINLSLGTHNPAHREPFEKVIARATEAGLVVVAAQEDSGRALLPGCLGSVIGVRLDWDCPRQSYRFLAADSQPVFLASGYARPFPGVPLEHNLKGISFAVANMTGFVARAREACPGGGLEALQRILIGRTHLL